jgi:hypothetical protein
MYALYNVQMPTRYALNIFMCACDVIINQCSLPVASWEQHDCAWTYREHFVKESESKKYFFLSEGQNVPPARCGCKF